MVRCPTEYELEQFLEGTCAPEARAHIEGHRESCASCRDWLLEAGSQDELLSPVRELFAGPRPAPLPPSSEPPRLARYRVLRRIGAGGMGVVWEAEQQSPRRKVALKLMRSQLASPHSLRRFEHEAQVLARLDHPGIARIFEADTIESLGERQPFFAMELVEGLPLTEHVERAGLGRREVVELLAQVCDAVQHAHQKGVVHRDLKPSNILVTADGTPKVLDFGVARTLEAEGEAGSLRSEAGELVGTLPFMSPEQVSGLPDAVDTRTDVYALGVLLYRLLAGRLPIEVKGASLPEAVRRIADSDPPRLGQLDPHLRGDLDAIASKALEKDRERRYSSAAALADDLRRWLRLEPVSAHAPGGLYQLRKLARRNRLASALVLLALTLLIGGIAATGWQALRAGRAESAERVRAEELARQIKRLGVVNDFFKRLLDAGNLKKSGNAAGYTVRAMLLDAAERLEEQPLEDPVIEAELRVTLGDALNSIGLGERAIAHLERAVELRIATAGPDAKETAGARNALGVAFHELGREDEALGQYRAVLAIYDTLEGVDPEWLEPRRATTLSNLGRLHLDRRETEQAYPLLVEALELHRRHLGRDHSTVATDLALLANLAWKLGDPERTVEYQREAVETLRRLDTPVGSPLMMTIYTLGFYLSETGRTAEAEELLREALSRIDEYLGADHPARTRSLIVLSGIRRRSGDAVGAVAFAEQAIDAASGATGDTELQIDSLECLAQALEADGDAQGAASVRAEAAELRR